MANTYLTNTNPTAGNRTKGTISVWFKRSGLGSYQHLYTEHYDGNNFGSLRLNNSDTLSFLSYDGGSAQADIGTTRVFRDTNSWYHVVASWDTTNGTASDRVKIYINGVRETSFSGSPTYPSSSQNIYFGVGGTSYPIRVGSISNSAQFFDGSMSHFHRVDNQALAQTVFGSTDSVTGEWNINTSPSITYTGSSSFNFFILKDGNSVTDQSGQSNNLTVGGGTLTKTEDCPSNVFATINLLDNFYNGLTITNGNTSWVSGSPYSVTRSTLGASSGKYYFEMKVVNEGNTDYEFGIVGAAGTSTSSWMGSSGSYGYSYESNAELRANGTTVDPWGSTYDDGDILGCAFDLDNNKIYFSKNGSWQESGNPSAGSNGYTIVAAADTPAGAYFVGAGDFSGSSGQSGQFNFGNGYFGTTAVSSAGSNASNNGIFEYDVPTGYTALSTKGLNL